MIRIFPKIFLLFFLSLVVNPFTTLAQEDLDSDAPSNNEKVGKATFSISGAMYDDGLRMEGVAITVEEDDEVVSEVFSDGNGKFKVKLKLDKVYSIIFTKDDYVDKIVDVDTRNVAMDNRKYDFSNVGWRVDMYPKDLDVDYSVLSKPVALVVYNPAADEFTTDKKYERSVRPRIEKLIKDVYAALDQRDMDREDAFDDYMLAVKDGDLYLKEGDYESALMQYEAAKDIMPNETYPDKQINKTMAMMQANKSVDEQYASHLQVADEAFESKEWDLARTSYEMAHDVKPKMSYPKEQIELIISNITAEKLAASKMAEEERLAQYNGLVASADSLLAAKAYRDSRSKYSDALAMYSKKEYPKSKIKEINTILTQNEKAEGAYAELLSNANNFLNNREYEKAKEAYTNAIGIRPDDALPKQKLKEIDALLVGLAALKSRNAEMEAKKQAALQAKYEGLIVTADALMVDKSYDKAKADYQSALVLISTEEYPKNQINLINKTLAELEGVDKQYSKLMANGLKNQSTNKLEQAKYDYEAALVLKPEEQAPKDAIAQIDAKLASISAGIAAKQKAIDDKFAGFVADGDANMALEKYTDAQSSYKQALTVKPKEEYPKTQLAIINDKLKGLALAAAASEKEAKELAAKELRYNQDIGKADQLYKSGNLTGAKAEYQNALLVFTGKAYPVSQIAEIDSKLEVLAASAAAKAKEEEVLKAKEANYHSIITKADAALASKDFVKARLEYQNAQKVFAEKSYPAKQIIKIEGLELAEKEKVEAAALLAAQEEANRERFNTVVAEGDALVAKGELQKGYYKYESAAKLITGDAELTSKMRDVTAKMEAERKLAEFHAKNDTEFNRQLAEKYPNGFNETTKKGGKTTTRIVVVDKGRGDEYKKEVYSYGAVFYFKNGKKIDESSYKRGTKGH